MRERGFRPLRVANKPIDRREKYCEKLNALGIDCSSDDIITSATAAADYLSAQYPERPTTYRRGRLGCGIARRWAGHDNRPRASRHRDRVTCFRRFDYPRSESAHCTHENNAVLRATIRTDVSCRADEIPKLRETGYVQMLWNETTDR